MLRFLLTLLTLVTAIALAFVAFYKGDIAFPVSEAEVQQAVDAELLEIGVYDEDGVKVSGTQIDIDMTAQDQAVVLAKADVDALGLELAVDARLESGVKLVGTEVFLTNINAADIQITERGQGGRSVGLGNIIGGLLGDDVGKELAEEALDQYLADIPIYDLKNVKGTRAALARTVLKDVRIDEDQLVITASLDQQRPKLLAVLGALLLLCIGGLLATRRRHA